MSVWIQKFSEIYPLKNTLIWHYTPRAPTMYICTEHSILTPIPFDSTSQKINYDTDPESAWRQLLFGSGYVIHDYKSFCKCTPKVWPKAS